jgi:hypothetical protein
MEERNGDKLIGKRWIVEGIYELSEETEEWSYSCEYKPGKVVWKFRETGTLVAYLDGREDYKIPFSIIRGKLHLDLDRQKPDVELSGYKESYLIDERNDAVWLYDLKTPRGKVYWLALRLIPAEQGN